jgi:hypothetical protein
MFSWDNSAAGNMLFCIKIPVDVRYSFVLANENLLYSNHPKIQELLMK